MPVGSSETGDRRRCERLLELARRMAFTGGKCQILRMVNAISTGAFTSTGADCALGILHAVAPRRIPRDLRSPSRLAAREARPQAASRSSSVGRSCTRLRRTYFLPKRLAFARLPVGHSVRAVPSAKKLLDRLVGRAYISLPPRRSFVVLPNRSDVVGCFGGLIGCSFDKLDDVKRGCAGGVRVVCASSEERG